MTKELPETLVKKAAEAIWTQHKGGLSMVFNNLPDTHVDKEDCLLQAKVALSCIPIMEMVEALQFIEFASHMVPAKTGGVEVPEEYQKIIIDEKRLLGRQARQCLEKLPEELIL